MAVEVLQAFPGVPSFRYRVTLDGVRFDVRFTWFERRRGWFLDVWTADGTPIVSGRRLSPGSSPLIGLGLDDDPAGLLYVSGPDPYNQADLGASLRVVYVSSADLVSTVADDGLTVTFP